MDSLYLSHATRAAGTIQLPGSKSISNRALLLAALARGTTTLEGVLDSDDTRVMREALEAVGVPIETLGSAERLRIHGAGAGTGFPIKKAELFVGNSGTTMRSIAAVLALPPGNYEVRGVERMHERPIGDLVGALRWLGARIGWLRQAPHPPPAHRPRARLGRAAVPVPREA